MDVRPTRLNGHMLSLESAQQIDQKLDQGVGIAADMPAVGQNLPLQFIAQPSRGRPHMSLLPRHAQRGVGQRHRHPSLGNEQAEPAAQLPVSWNSSLRGVLPPYPLE